MRILTSLAVAICASAAVAADYPARPIQLVMSYAVGSSVDVVFRIFGPKLSEHLGQQIVIVNRPGGAATIGTAQVAKAAPDGYTLLFVYTGHVLNPSLYPKLPFDTLRDFAPVSMLATNESFLLVPPSFPAKSVADLIATAKKNPGKYTIGALPSSAQHLGSELLKLRAGIDLLFIPYKGNGPALTDLLGGQLDMAFNTVAITLPLVQAGKLRVGLFASQFTKDAATGELKNLRVDVARALAARIGVPAVFIEHRTPPDTIACLKSGACDLVFLPRDERDREAEHAAHAQPRQSAVNYKIGEVPRKR